MRIDFTPEEITMLDDILAFAQNESYDNRHNANTFKSLQDKIESYAECVNDVVYPWEII